MSVNVEYVVEESLGKCKCCLDDRELKALWEVHNYDGDQEIYGLMLTECFALPWQPTEDAEYICELCISRLREAVHFKQEILATEEILLGEMNLKREQPVDDNEETIIEYVSQDEQIYYVNAEDVEEGDIKVELQSAQEEEEMTLAQNVPKEEVYEEVEYLDLEDELQGKPAKLESTESSQSSSAPAKRKWPKGKKKSERTKPYKQYTREELARAVRAVRSKRLSRAAAAAAYGVPEKTLVAKASRGDANPTKEAKSEKYFKLIDEIKTILAHTTAVPFRTRATRYYCFYCGRDAAHFEDARELRRHTRAAHAHERTKLELYMRPQWLNEIIKLDVEDMHCKTCELLLPDWNHLFVHFAEVHDLEFDLAYSRIIPYALDYDLKCVLCRQSFHNYGQLDAHMNSHYSNYICYECGDTFLTVTRLDKHLDVHKVGSYQCEMCDKVFTLEKYRTKHVILVHNQECNIKCLYCPAKFVGMFQRHVHVTEQHKEKVKTMTCEYCGNCYTWRPYFLTHLRRKHGAEKKHRCQHCDKTFLMSYELKNHMVRHTGERNFLCGLCGESFTRMISLKKHCETHAEFNASVQE